MIVCNIILHYPTLEPKYLVVGYWEQNSYSKNIIEYCFCEKKLALYLDNFDIWSAIDIFKSDTNILIASESQEPRRDKDEGHLHHLESWPGRELREKEEEKEILPQQGAEREGGKTWVIKTSYFKWN